MNKIKLYNDILPHLFRQEYAKMTAVLCRHFGLKHIEIAEDIASDTFLKASEHWAINGIPENPTAWLYTVAKNKTRDYFKHKYVFDTKVKPELKGDHIKPEHTFEFNQQIISDSQLAMIFAVCNPTNKPESQIALALQILCGFSVEEIANAFIAKPETIKKRLLRARTKLRNEIFRFEKLSKRVIEARLDAVLHTLYLLFNEGYFSKSSNRVIRKELCSESIRLTLELTDNKWTNIPKTNALLALMCFQSSRIEARINEEGETVLFDEQDKNKWDKSLIEKGNYYLINATNGHEISKYHLEAGIAYWHTTDNKDKWKKILSLYDQLIVMEYSPTTALNRVFAFSKIYGNEKAIPEVEKLNLIKSNQFYELLGYLYTTSDILKAIEHYKKAINLTTSKMEKHTLKKEIKRLKGKLERNEIVQHKDNSNKR